MDLLQRARAEGRRGDADRHAPALARRRACPTCFRSTRRAGSGNSARAGTIASRTRATATECARIATLVASALKGHPALAAWQIDNEYGCHDTTLSYSQAALSGFRAWLAAKYGSIDALNPAWGNVFWSMDYRDFDEIELPN